MFRILGIIVSSVTVAAAILGVIFLSVKKAENPNKRVQPNKTNK